ncbi:MAG: hypothetical protein J6P16_05390 [Eubacterium sp.]|nr:hypothetical protein [Eubacterium sp.]
MKYRFIPAFVMLLAGLITCILGIVQKWPVETNLIALVIVLVVFYIIGQIAGQIVGRVQSERKAMDELEKKQREAEEARRKAEEEEKERLEHERLVAEESERRRKLAEERYEREHQSSFGDDSDDFDEDAFDEYGNYIGG